MCISTLIIKFCFITKKFAFYVINGRRATNQKNVKKNCRRINSNVIKVLSFCAKNSNTLLLKEGTHLKGSVNFFFDFRYLGDFFRQKNLFSLHDTYPNRTVQPGGRWRAFTRKFVPQRMAE